MESVLYSLESIIKINLEGEIIMIKKYIYPLVVVICLTLLLSSCIENVQTISPTAEPSETVAETETTTQTETETSVPETTPKKLPAFEDVSSVCIKGNTIDDVCKVLGEYEDYVIGYSYVWYFWTLDTGENLTIWFKHNKDYANFENWDFDKYTISEKVSYDEAVAFDDDKEVTINEIKEKFGEGWYVPDGAYIWRLDNGQFLRFYQRYYPGFETEEDSFKFFLQIIEPVPYEKTLNVKEGMTFQEALDILGYTGTFYSTNFVTEYAWELDNGQLFKIHFDTWVLKADLAITEVIYIDIPKE